MRVRVKICGITRPEWAVAAADAGADAIGLVFARSPRQVSPDEAAEIVRALPPWVAPVGVFVDESPAAICEIAARVGLDAAQLHGDEPPDMVAELVPLKVVKALRIGGEKDVQRAHAWREACRRLGREPDAYLVDAKVTEGPKGGTGRPADWDLAVRLALGGFRPLILSGGLSADNVAEAIRRVRPWGVDASSGLETAPGRKDPDRIRAFIEAVRGVNA